MGEGWCRLLKPFIESDRFDAIFRFLKEESKVKKKTILPDSKDLFKSFLLCPPDKIRAIVLLMDPYPTVKKVKGIDTPIANGVPMDCSNTGIPQPSLDAWYDAIEQCYDLPLDSDIDRRVDLSYLLQEEGVLLLNSSLTVEKDKSNSHAAIWEPFMTYLFESVINEYMTGLPIVLCGTSAQKYEKYINPMRHYILKVEHMAAASYQSRAWKHQEMFRWINEILKNNNGVYYQVRWWRKKGEDNNKDLPSWVTDKVDEDDIKSDLPWAKKKPWDE